MALPHDGRDIATACGPMFGVGQQATTRDGCGAAVAASDSPGPRLLLPGTSWLSPEARTSNIDGRGERAAADVNANAG